MENKALIVVDVQRDFCEGGSLAVAGGTRLAGEIKDYAVNSDYRYIVATKDWHINPGNHWSENPDFVDSWPIHCEVGTKGADFMFPLDDSLFNNVFYKGQFEAAYSGFEGSSPYGITLTDWLDYVEVSEIDIVGIAYDYCVKATALDGARLGFKTKVIKRLTASVKPDNDVTTTVDLFEGGVSVA